MLLYNKNRCITYLMYKGTRKTNISFPMYCIASNDGTREDMYWIANNVQLVLYTISSSIAVIENRIVYMQSVPHIYMRTIKRSSRQSTTVELSPHTIVCVEIGDAWQMFDKLLNGYACNMIAYCRYGLKCYHIQYHTQCRYAYNIQSTNIA